MIGNVTKIHGNVAKLRGMGNCGTGSWHFFRPSWAFGFGGVPIANLYTPVPNDVVLDAIRTALDLGIRYFDTAPFYGFGLGERRMGLGLAEVPRDTVVLSTKVGRTLSPARGAVDHGVFVDAPPFVATFDFTGDAILRQVDASLQRLGTDRLDCVVIHDLGLWHMGTTEALEHHFKDLRGSGLAALSRLKAEGVIGAIGAGANELTLCDRFLALEQLDFILLALRFTLLDQSAFPRTLDSALRRGKGVVVGAPFQSGILATAQRRPGWPIMWRRTRNFWPAWAVSRRLRATMQSRCGRWHSSFRCGTRRSVRFLRGCDRPRRCGRTWPLCKSRFRPPSGTNWSWPGSSLILRGPGHERAGRFSTRIFTFGTRRTCRMAGLHRALRHPLPTLSDLSAIPRRYGLAAHLTGAAPSRIVGGIIVEGGADRKEAELDWIVAEIAGQDGFGIVARSTCWARMPTR